MSRRARDRPGADHRLFTSHLIDLVAGLYATSDPDAPQDRLDGLTVDLGDWWFNLRPSNTEPLLRLNLEAADRAACDAHTEEVLALIRAESQEN